MVLQVAHGCADITEESTPPVLEPSRIATAESAHASLFDWSSLPLLQGRSYHQYSTHERGSVTAGRWHVLTDSIEFRESLDFSFEYGADRPRTAERYASVAYYYLFE
jgi:hypothetical protein